LLIPSHVDTKICMSAVKRAQRFRGDLSDLYAIIVFCGHKDIPSDP
jgi:hypothetical protein